MLSLGWANKADTNHTVLQYLRRKEFKRNSLQSSNKCNVHFALREMRKERHVNKIHPAYFFFYYVRFIVLL